MKKISLFKFCYAFISVLVSSYSYAQQYHFSQYFSSPLSVNPALTGYYDGNVRVTSVYRNQWGQDNNPFITISASGESKLFQNSTAGKLGIGLMVNSDRSNNNALAINTGTISIAYNLPLDAEENVELGVGLQADYTQKKINPYSLNFESQFVVSGFNSSIITPEMSKANSSAYFGANTGLMLNVKISPTDKIYVGAALYHANQPKVNLFDTLYRQPCLYVLNAGARFSLSDQSHIQLSSIYSAQQQASEALVGGVGVFDIDDTKSFQIGGWYRLKDAIIPYVALSWEGFELGLSYDVTTSQLTQSMLKNSFELSLKFNTPDNSAVKKRIPWY